MKKEKTNWTCDACLVARETTESQYYIPLHWAQVDVSFGTQSHRTTEMIHFCPACWQEGKAPLKEQAPALIRRFFGWNFKAKEAQPNEGDHNEKRK